MLIIHILGIHSKIEELNIFRVTHDLQHRHDLI